MENNLDTKKHQYLKIKKCLKRNFNAETITDHEEYPDGILFEINEYVYVLTNNDQFDIYKLLKFENGDEIDSFESDPEKMYEYINDLFFDFIEESIQFFSQSDIYELVQDLVMSQNDLLNKLQDLKFDIEYKNMNKKSILLKLEKLINEI